MAGRNGGVALPREQGQEQGAPQACTIARGPGSIALTALFLLPRSVLVLPVRRHMGSGGARRPAGRPDHRQSRHADDTCGDRGPTTPTARTSACSTGNSNGTALASAANACGTGTARKGCEGCVCSSWRHRRMGLVARCVRLRGAMGSDRSSSRL